MAKRRSRLPWKDAEKGMKEAVARAWERVLVKSAALAMSLSFFFFFVCLFRVSKRQVSAHARNCGKDG